MSGSVQCHVSEALLLTAPACPAEMCVFHTVACQLRSPAAGRVLHKPPDTE